MVIKYLYIDDDKPTKAKATVMSINNVSKGLSIDVEQVKAWQHQLKFLIDNQEEFDGYILDLKLNEEKDVKYRGLALAQELRTLATEDKEIKKGFPIILCSANEKFEESYNKDSTGHNLFDIAYSKLTMADDYKRVHDELIDLANAYMFVNKTQNLHEILGLKPNHNVDPLVIDHLDNLIKKPTHELILFFKREIIESSSVLIDEKSLAAKLGVDYERSLDWKFLLDQILRDFSYNGILSDAWPRWWKGELINWIQESFGFGWRAKDARERVDILKEKYGLKELQSPNPTKYSKSTKFWTVCIGTGNPIDPNEGLIIEGQDNKFPWQEKERVSIYEAVERTNLSRWKSLSVIENERFEVIKIRVGRELSRKRQ
ncbi:MAG: hypothetical protein AAFP89_06655 [Bacteroidota bacterium]